MAVDLEAPPAVPTSSSSTDGPSSAEDNNPVSPVARQTSFPHRTVSAAPVHPFIDTATPAINSTPIELDGTPTSPQDTRQGDDDDDDDDDSGSGSSGEQGQRSGGRTLGRRGSRGPGGEIFSPSVHDEVMEELSGMKGEGSREREKRAALLSARSKDPAVLVDIPQTPGADEIEIAGRAVREGGPTATATATGTEQKVAS